MNRNERGRENQREKGRGRCREERGREIRGVIYCVSTLCTCQR